MSSENEQYFYPNRWPRIILMSTEEIVGERGVAALLNLAGLPEYIGNYPADNMKREVDDVLPRGCRDVVKFSCDRVAALGDRAPIALSVSPG